MKQITLTEASASLSEYGKLCQQERVIVTENGQPVFELAPVETEDFMSDLIESNADFRKDFSSRRGGKFVAVDEALQRLKD